MVKTCHIHKSTIITTLRLMHGRNSCFVRNV